MSGVNQLMQHLTVEYVTCREAYQALYLFLLTQAMRNTSATFVHYVCFVECCRRPGFIKTIGSTALTTSEKRISTTTHATDTVCDGACQRDGSQSPEPQPASTSPSVCPRSNHEYVIKRQCISIFQTKA